MNEKTLRPEIIFNEKAHSYLVNGKKFPSVTTIIGATVPKDLSWWGMTVGCEGIYRALQDDDYRLFLLYDAKSGDDLVELLKTAKLTTNHQMRKGAKTGTAIHKALERYAKGGDAPNPLDFDEADRPRIMALAGWLVENQPEFLGSEIRTASLEHEYAGTFDLRARLHRGEHKGKVALIDLKNTKYVYPDQHFPQLEAYEQSERESGEAPTDMRAVLHLPPVGPARLEVSTDTFQDFAVLLAHYQSIQARKVRLKNA